MHISLDRKHLAEWKKGEIIGLILELAVVQLEF